VLAGHRFIRWVEDVLFQLRVQLKLGKDLFRNQMLGAKIPGALISGKKIFDLSMISFEQRNGIDRILRLIVPVCHGIPSLSPALGSGACRVGVGIRLGKLYAIEEAARFYRYR
jgi:hypothetical protein